MLLKDHSNIFELVIPYITRDPTPEEADGKNYHFIKAEEFNQMASEEKFLVKNDDKNVLLGITKEDVETISKNKKIAILNVGVKGAQEINKANVDANYMFIYPPNPDELKERISHRIEDDDAIKNMLENGLREVEAANKTILYKHKIINNKLETSYEEFKELLLRIYKEEVKIISKGGE